jgi:Lrp/AsnC family transcriptional regulator, leucine-responsive regulatory protein
MINRDKLLDDKGVQLLRALQENARASYSDLAKSVGLSVPSVTERVRKFEDAGIIKGYHAEVDMGLPIRAVVRLTGTGTQMAQLAGVIQNMPEVSQAYRMTGESCFLVMVKVASMSHLEAFSERISRYGQAQTSIIVSTVVERQIVDKRIVEKR